MSLRRRRAVAPVSISASTTIRPLTMCNPPANRSIDETSALRQQGRVTIRWASSSLTAAVMAMGSDPVTRVPGRCEEATQSGRQTVRVVLVGVVVTGQCGQLDLGTEEGRPDLEGRDVGDTGGVRQHDVERQVRCVPGE